jgi:hypothetical protein
MTKKAQVNKLTSFALTLVVFAIVLAIGLSILTRMRDSQRSIGSAFDSNNTFTPLNATSVTFAVGNALTCTGAAIVNNSGTDVTSSFTVSGCYATLKDVSQNNTAMTANYTFSYYEYSASYNASASNISAMGEIPGWVPVIIVAIIGGIVLFLIIRQFGNR